uniref:hypothetical protein n=1 Tax=Aliarcobacter sp. TaxID=2321116 RepID=UPI0040478EBF
MKISELDYEVTTISLENFKQRSFEIIFDVFYAMNTLDDESAKEYVSIIGTEEFDLSTLYRTQKYTFN